MFGKGVASRLEDMDKQHPEAVANDNFGIAKHSVFCKSQLAESWGCALDGFPLRPLRGDGGERSGVGGAGFRAGHRRGEAAPGNVEKWDAKEEERGEDPFGHPLLSSRDGPCRERNSPARKAAKTSEALDYRIVESFLLYISRGSESTANITQNYDAIAVLPSIAIVAFAPSL